MSRRLRHTNPPTRSSAMLDSTTTCQERPERFGGQPLGAARSRAALGSQTHRAGWGAAMPPCGLWFDPGRRRCHRAALGSIPGGAPSGRGGAFPPRGPLCPPR
eukprot:3101950-Prymnesium_polylepis.1